MGTERRSPKLAKRINRQGSIVLFGAGRGLDHPRAPHIPAVPRPTLLCVAIRRLGLLVPQLTCAVTQDSMKRTLPQQARLCPFSQRQVIHGLPPCCWIFGTLDALRKNAKSHTCRSACCGEQRFVRWQHVAPGGPRDLDIGMSAISPSSVWNESQSNSIDFPYEQAARLGAMLPLPTNRTVL
jgi:hypothetical protein